MYRSITFFAFSLLLTSVAGAQSYGPATDGAWWIGLSYDEKVIAMATAQSAYFRGELERAYFTVQETEAEEARFPDSAEKRAEKKAWRDAFVQTHLSPHLPMFVEHDQSLNIDKITRFYSRHPDKMNLEFSSLLRCVKDDPDMTCDAVAKSAF